MIAKIKNIWYDLIHKGEKNMPTTNTETGATRKLKAQVKSQSNEIERLRARVGELVDNIYILERDLSRFKDQVADDIRMVFEKIEQ
jgi:predicted RNase H-like nuclease (RuvC/YqgF family)